MYDLINAVLPMSMDVYRQFDTQDTNTGAIKKTWQFERTVPCHAKGLVSNSASSRTGEQILSVKYSNDQILQIRTTGKITLREKITNIRDMENNVIWEEINFPSNTPTVFEVIGTTPMTDPTGMVIGYNSTVKRSENQAIGY